MPKHTFQKSKIIGLVFVLCGIVSLLENFDTLAVIVSFIAGINLVLSRTLNAKLAEYTSVRISTFYNYFTGLFFAIIVYFILGKNELMLTNFSFSPKIYIYFGGIIGVCIILLSNIIVVKISSFYLSLFIFIGQVFSGILIDIFISQIFSFRNMIGGLFVTIGLCINILLEKKYK